MNASPDYFKVSSSETALTSEIPNVADENIVIKAPGQDNTPVSILNDEFCKKLAFPYLFPTGRFKALKQSEKF